METLEFAISLQRLGRIGFGLERKIKKENYVEVIFNKNRFEPLQETF